MRLGALGATGEYHARHHEPVTDVTGAPVADLSLVPPLFVDRTMKSLRHGHSGVADERVAKLIEAARLFATADLAGLPVAEYERLVSRTGGVPISVVHATTAALRHRWTQLHRTVRNGQPWGAVTEWRDPLTRTGHAVWVRRADVFAVHAAGNHPGTHSLWPEALALGYRVAVRPSRREPFTPHRLVTALRAAGFGNDQVALLPTDHATAGALLRGADLSLVYGGDDVVAKFAGDPAVLPQGPGRSKILLTADVDWRDHLDTIADSVSGHGGTGCVNTTAVLVEGDPAPLCEALAERLAVLPVLPPDDEKAVLPVQRLSAVRAIGEHLTRRAEGTRCWLGDVVGDLGDGSAALRPVVHQVSEPDAPQMAVELPFPCVWVAPWTRAAGIAPLRNSLVVTVITRDSALVDALVEEPSVRNVHVGDHPTHWMAPGLPHDGFLSEFLMRAKAVVRD